MNSALDNVRIEFDAKRNKKQLEELHLSAFQRILAQQFPPIVHIEAPFQHCPMGASNPPDFYVQRGGVTVAVDFTQLNMPNYQEGSYLLAHYVTEFKLAARGVDLTHLDVFDIGVRFSGHKGYPPQPGSEQLQDAKALVDSLREFSPPRAPAAWEADNSVEAGPISQIYTWSGNVSATTSWDVMANQGRMPGQPPGPRLSWRLPGFALSPDDFLGLVNRLVEKHDKESIDELVLTLGATYRSGHRVPEEANAAYFLDRVLLAGRSINSPKNLKRVWLHAWSPVSRVYLLFDRPVVPSRN